MSGKTIYLDNSATTRLDERVLEAMRPIFLEKYAVATSEFAYTAGVEAREALDGARASIAAALGAAPEEVIFTSGATESGNLALKGVARALRDKRRHIVISAIEDFPVLNSARALEKEGWDVTRLPVSGEGFVVPEILRGAIRDDTALVSVQHANQEIGTLQDISALAEVCREKGVTFHADATHTFRRVPLDVGEVPVDLVTVSAHTLHGSRGIGGLYVRKGTRIARIQDGGYQEYGLRAGIEDIPGAVGFARAVELVTPEETERLRGLRDRLIAGVFARIPDVTLNGPRERRLPQNANLTFHYVEGESLVLHLDSHGIAVSTGSACFSRSLEASHVIMGIGGDHERAHGSLRFTFGRFNDEAEVDTVLAVLEKVVAELRRISPLGPKR